MDRRTLLKSMAAVTGGAAAAGFGVDSVLAADPTGRTIDGPVVEARPPQFGTPASPLVQAFSGLADFHTVVSANTWSFGGAYGLRPTNTVDGYSTDRLRVGHGSVLLSAVFYVGNTAAPLSTCYLLRVNPVNSTFAPFISKQPAASTSGIQVVTLDLPAGGLVIDNATYSTTLAWYPTASDGSQILYGAKITYAHDPGAQFLPAPVRVADTRAASLIGPITGPLANGSTYDFPIAGANGIPANANAIFGNLTAVEFNPGSGYMTLFPTGAALPNASSLNFGGGEPNQLANFFQVKLGTGGKVSLYVSGTSTNAILDVAGYVT